MMFARDKLYNSINFVSLLLLCTDGVVGQCKFSYTVAQCHSSFGKSPRKDGVLELNQDRRHLTWDGLNILIRYVKTQGALI